MSSALMSGRLISLLSEWNARREAGRPCDAAELCPDDPSLRKQLAAHINAIQKVEGQREAFAAPGSADSTPRAAATASTAVNMGLPSPPGLTIQDELGRGGMGVVFRAMQSRLNRTVALKMILLDRKPDRAEVTRFLAEAEAMAAVRHPNVVQVFDCGESDGRPYMTMELLTAGTLKERLPKKGMGAKSAAELVEKLARGVAAAHAAGIVHRDLKPGNVLFDADDTPKVSDFGLAKRGESDQTQTNALVGTPAYMSPEQARGEGKFAGPPADVWALGVMLYECLTGKRPFAGANPLEVMDRITNATPERPSKLATVPRDLERVCLKCLAKEPADRYRSASALAEDLAAFREGRPVSARPVPAVVKLWKWTKRNPVPTALIAAVIVGLTALALYFREGKLRVEEVRRSELIGSARLAMQKGNTNGALDFLKQAEDAGQQLTDEQRLDTARLLFDITAKNRRTYLNTIDPAKLAPDLRGRWHLMNGADLIGRDELQATAQLTQSLELLPPESGEAYYAKSLLEEDPERALKLLDESIRRDPTALAPRHMDMFIRLMLGRFDEMLARSREARALAPDDPQVAMLTFLGQSVQGSEAETKWAESVMRKQFPSELMDVLVVVWPNFVRANSAAHLGDPDLPKELERKLAELGPGRLQAAFAQLQGDGPHSPLLQRIPRCIQPLTAVLGHNLQVSFGMVQPPPEAEQTGRLLSDDQFKELARVVHRYDEGFVQFMYAGELMSRRKTFLPGGAVPADRKQSAAEATTIAEAYERGWRAKGFLFDYRQMCVDGAILFYSVASVGTRANTDYDVSLARKCAALIRERMTDPRLKSQPLHSLRPTVGVRPARVAGEWALVHELLERLQKEMPHNPELDPELAAYHFHTGDYESARMRAMMALEFNPDDTECRQIFADSTAKLHQLGKAGY